MLRVVYDNVARGDYIADWGFSCIVNYRKKILFDTGANSSILLHNLSLTKVNDFDYVFLSHEHHDHVGGIDAVLNRTSCVVALNSFSKRLKEKIMRKTEIIEVKGSFEFDKNFFTTGELNGIEQSLVIKTKNGCFVLTGCSHPGLERIIFEAEKFGEVFGIMGGFHGFRNISMLRDFDVVIPCHCTAYKNEILRLENAKECFAGCKYVLLH